MNKGELIDVIASKAEVTKKDADAALTATLEAIVEAVASGDKVTGCVAKTGARDDRVVSLSL